MDKHSFHFFRQSQEVFCENLNFQDEVSPGNADLLTNFRLPSPSQSDHKVGFVLFVCFQFCFVFDFTCAFKSSGCKVLEHFIHF